MPRRPRPAHRALPGQIQKYNHGDESETLDTLKRRREDKDEDEDNGEDEDEEVDPETDIDADADAPRVVQWLDDGDDAFDELKQKVAEEVCLYSRSQQYAE